MTYTTPTGGIFSMPPVLAPETIHDGAAIAAWLTAAGMAATCVNTINAPQLVQYDLNLTDVLQIGKLKRLLPALSATLHCDVQQTGSSTAHFALLVSKDAPRPLYFREALETVPFTSSNCTTALLGVDTNNQTATLDIATAPHTLIAGTTGSGKTTLMHTILTSLLCKATPDDIKFVMIDTKRTELMQYAGIPHLFAPPIDNAAEALAMLENLCGFMDSRYSRFAAAGVSDITSYAALYPEQSAPRVIVVVDELADLMLLSPKQTETALVRLAQLGRAAGIHLILATQNPLVKVVTGLLKANLPARVVLKCASNRESMNVIDKAGADKLLGRGDALLKLPTSPDLQRLQAAYISQQDIQAIVNHWRAQVPPPPTKPGLFSRIKKALWG